MGNQFIDSVGSSLCLSVPATGTSNSSLIIFSFIFIFIFSLINLLKPLNSKD
jgi:hypothetical protein